MKKNEVNKFYHKEKKHENKIANSCYVETRPRHRGVEKCSLDNALSWEGWRFDSANSVELLGPGFRLR